MKESTPASGAKMVTWINDRSWRTASWCLLALLLLGILTGCRHATPTPTPEPTHQAFPTPRANPHAPLRPGDPLVLAREAGMYSGPHRGDDLFTTLPAGHRLVFQSVDPPRAEVLDAQKPPPNIGWVDIDKLQLPPGRVLPLPPTAERVAVCLGDAGVPAEVRARLADQVAAWAELRWMTPGAPRGTILGFAGDAALPVRVDVDPAPVVVPTVTPTPVKPNVVNAHDVALAATAAAARADEEIAREQQRRLAAATAALAPFRALATGPDSGFGLGCLERAGAVLRALPDHRLVLIPVDARAVVRAPSLSAGVLESLTVVLIPVCGPATGCEARLAPLRRAAEEAGAWPVVDLDPAVGLEDVLQ